MIAVAIDGPAGAGKSTIAKRIARELGFTYVDTGALYRAIALYVQRREIDPDDAVAVEAALKQLSVDIKHVQGEQHVVTNGEDVSDAIRTPEVSMGASKVSAVPAVRAFLLELQRDLARRYNVIMDGRDIGTVVLPHANIKIFLSASPEDRARRRHLEMSGKGMESDYESVLADIIKRDENDRNRPIAPLKPAEGALMADTTGNTLEQSIAQITKLIKERLS